MKVTMNIRTLLPISTLSTLTALALTTASTPAVAQSPAYGVAVNHGDNDDDDHATGANMTADPDDRVMSPTVDVGLHVISGGSVKDVTDTRGQSDFGTVSTLDTPRVGRTFMIRNDGKTPLKLARLQMSTVHTMATVERVKAGVDADDDDDNNAVASAPYDRTLPTLAPGQQARVRVTIDLTGAAAGSWRDDVTVYTQGQVHPIAMLDVVGQVRPSVTVSPTLIDFGKVDAAQVGAGHDEARTLTVTLDSRLAAAGTAPALVSTNPDIVIEPQPEVVTQFTDAKEKPHVSADRVLTYRVSLAKDAAAGPITGRLTLASTKTGPSVAMPMVSMAGQVVGDVSASPVVVSFGTVHQGQQTQRRVTLTGADANKLDGLRAVSGSPWFTVASLTDTPVFVDGQVAASSRELSITLSPQAPSGVLQGQIKVELASGQRLMIPVTASIASR